MYTHIESPKNLELIDETGHMLALILSFRLGVGQGFEGVQRLECFERSGWSNDFERSSNAPNDLND